MAGFFSQYPKTIRSDQSAKGKGMNSFHFAQFCRGVCAILASVKSLEFDFFTIFSFGRA
jgi:hypothetical protein